MSTAPEPPTGSASPSAPESPPASGSAPASAPSLGRDAVWTLAVSAVVHPLMVGTVLLISEFMSAPAAHPVALFGLAALVMTGVSHLLLLSVMRRLRVPRAWEFPTILSVAALVASAHAVAVLAGGAQSIWFLPLTCLLLSLLGAAGWAVTRNRRKPRLLSGLAATVSAVLVFTGGSWLSDEVEDREERERLTRELADYSLPVAILTSRDWEPSNMRIVDSDAREESAEIDYVPVDPSPELEGFSLTLRSEALAPTAGADWRYPHLCISGDGLPVFEDNPWTDDYRLLPGEDVLWVCGVREEAVFTPGRDEEGNEVTQAYLEIADGAIAILTMTLPDDRQGDPPPDFFYTGIVGLAEYVRAARAGEAEEVALAVTE